MQRNAAQLPLVDITSTFQQIVPDTRVDSVRDQKKAIWAIAVPAVFINQSQCPDICTA
jgi:hypothetical protein